MRFNANANRSQPVTAGLEIRIGLPDDLRRDAARLYLEAFDAKLGPILGRSERATEFLARVLRPEHAVVALRSDGALVGVAGFHDEDGGLIGGDASDFRAVYGAVGGPLRAAAMSLFERTPAVDEILLDGMAVDVARRGEGVGSALLDAVIDHATARRKRRLVLEVVDANPRARALYERKGFATVELRTRPVIGRAFGFRAIEVMERRLEWVA